MPSSSERENFWVRGPRHLTNNIDWSNGDHRRSVAASLVQGVYIQERDRQDGRHQQNSLAAPWWAEFGFSLHQPLIDPTTGAIFGAVYHYAKNDLEPPAPTTVIAFRGTIRKGNSLAEDIKTDIYIIGHGLHTTGRYAVALDVVRWHCRDGPSIWLAGHSMGASIAMMVGRQMYEEQRLTALECYAFNPPYVGLSLERIRDKRVRKGLHVFGSVVAAGMALALHGKERLSHNDRSFMAVREWVPSLFVNPRDDVCSGYIGHFESHHAVRKIGGESIANIAAQHSVGGLIMSACGVDSKASHLIPSAKMFVNRGPPSRDFKHAHGIHQWWSTDLRLDCRDCRIG